MKEVRQLFSSIFITYHSRYLCGLYSLYLSPEQMQTEAQEPARPCTPPW